MAQLPGNTAPTELRHVASLEECFGFRCSTDPTINPLSIRIIEFSGKIVVQSKSSRLTVEQPGSKVICMACLAVVLT